MEAPTGARQAARSARVARPPVHRLQPDRHRRHDLSLPAGGGRTSNLHPHPTPTPNPIPIPIPNPNSGLTPDPFHYLQYMASSPHVLWRPEQITVRNTLLPLPLFFIVYDAFYAPFHRALHHRSIYAYVHKHHHRQVVPTRGNTDAINVHPFEFLVGE